MRYLINDDGRLFDGEELGTLREELDGLGDDDRVSFRNDNAQTIAQHPGAKILIVSGPGTGKSTVFKQRIIHWLESDPSSRILVLTFVRKLVSDLVNDIAHAPELTKEQKQQVEVHTLHAYARSVVERNHGTSKLQFQPHLRIIGPSWKLIVWEDTLQLAGEADDREFGGKQFEAQLHNAAFDEREEWRKLKETYFVLSQFYNAAGFGDLIMQGAVALSENRSLKEHHFFIIDEYQDFNKAEEDLILALTSDSQGQLIVGDDDQVLYEKLKSGKAELIRGLYADEKYVNAMLPFCSRSSLHIVKAAESFLGSELDKASIKKIYLPLRTSGESTKVRVIGCATPGTAVDYIRTFIEAHREQIEARKTELSNGTEKDPFLLILTPQKEAKFYAMGEANRELAEIVAVYKEEVQRLSEDYFKVLAYYSLANHPENNFTFRKVMYYENVSRETVTALLELALQEEKDFRALRNSEPVIDGILTKCEAIRAIVDGANSAEEKVREFADHIKLFDRDTLVADITRHELTEAQASQSEADEEEQAELDELDSQRMSAVELITIVGAKGLSADHVIIIGFDEVNMSWITRNAFYVALTRPRESLHLITCLKAGGSKEPHSFLAGLPEEHVEFYRYTKTNHRMTVVDNQAGFRKYLGMLTWVAAQATKRPKK